MNLRWPGVRWVGATDEVRGIAILRCALVPIALFSQSSHNDAQGDLFPYVVVAFSVYAVLSLLMTFVSRRRARLSLIPALIDLCAVALLVYTTGGEHSDLRFAFYVLPIAAAVRLSPGLTATWAALSVIAYLAVTIPHPDTVLPGDLDRLLGDSLSLLWVSAAAVMLSALVGGRQRALVAFAEMRRELVQRALDARADEQRRLAEALHDQAMQNVLVARQEITDIEHGVPGAAARARAALDETDRQLRHEIFAMHPLGLEQAGLSPVLRSLADTAARQGRFSVSLSVSNGAERSDHRELLVLTARELLTNAAKHAHAEHVHVRVSNNGQALTLSVADDGCGVTPSEIDEAVRGGHIGLATIRERIRSRAGRLDVASSPGGGTTVSVTIPTT